MRIQSVWINIIENWCVFICLKVMQSKTGVTVNHNQNDKGYVNVMKSISGQIIA